MRYKQVFHWVLEILQCRNYENWSLPWYTVQSMAGSYINTKPKQRLML
jgi:hypothetical protein